MLLTLTFQTRENKQKCQLSKQARGFSQGEILMAKKLYSQNTITAVNNKFWLSNALSLSKGSVNPDTNTLYLSRGSIITRWKTHRGSVIQGKVLQMVKQN